MPTNGAGVTETNGASRPGLPVVVVGAGPAGLTAAYQLSKAGRRALVLESDNVVGGISRTVERDGWRFDIGGHRFFTKVLPVEELWHEILPDEDFLLRPRAQFPPEGSLLAMIAGLRQMSLARALRPR